MVEDDYNVYTGDILERYFRQRMKESMNYRQIGSLSMEDMQTMSAEINTALKTHTDTYGIIFHPEI